jgi:hypothetical protein
MLNLSIVSGTYNRLASLQRMVESVRKSVLSLTYEIILVDGGSTDGTLEWARKQHDVILLEQGELLGAIKAFNAGAELAKGKYVAFLNDDIEVYEATLFAAYTYFEEHPNTGQIAFENKIANPQGDPNRTSYGSYNGYLYGQCSMTPKVLGDLAGWWGNEGMRTYAGDTRFSLRLWELGYPTVKVPGCAIVDHVVVDELRKVNNETHRGPGQGHPDTDLFLEHWQGRLPQPENWLATKGNLILQKAHNGTLRTMRFKTMMRPEDQMRTAMIDAFAKYGPTEQVNADALLQAFGQRGFFDAALERINKFMPDLLIIQAQHNRYFSPYMVMSLQRTYPNMFIINWDGDTHYPLTQFHFEIASVVDLQLIVSPSLFETYREKGIAVGYWPIAVEQEYIDIGKLKLRETESSKHGVTFMGALYGLGSFPEAETRRDVVSTLYKQLGKNFSLFGYGWEAIGIKGVQYTGEKHRDCALIYAHSKLGLSISQASDLWGYSSDRLYNICASGCPALIQRFAGMEEHGFVDGDTCIAFANLKEMLEKADYYLNHAVEREAIGERGRIMTVKRHNWGSRVRGLFAMLEDI